MKPTVDHCRACSRRSRRGAVTFALTAVVLAGGGTPARAAPGLETILQDDGSLLGRPIDRVRATMGRLRGLGVDTVRLTANWSILAPAPSSHHRPAFKASDPAAYPQDRWRGLDNAVTLASQTGIHTLIDVGFFAPVWATSERRGPRARTNIDPQAFRDFAVAVVRRYSGTWTVPQSPGAPPPPGPLPAVGRLTLWNEPNQPGLMMPQWVRGPDGPHPASARIYRRMVQLAYPAIKAVRPDVTVLVGNTSSTGSYRFRGPVPPLRFLRDLACVDAHYRPMTRGDCRHFSRVPGDGWSHHPYAPVTRPDLRSSQPDDALVADLPHLSAVLRRLIAMHRLAPGLRTIYETEFGYETHRTPGRAPLSQSQQSRWITWAEYVSQRTPAVRSYAQFLLRDQAPGAVKVSDTVRPFGQYYTGLEEANGRPKLAERSFVAGLFAQRSSPRRVMLWARLRLGSGPRVIRFERRVGRRGAWRAVGTAGPRGGPRRVQLTLDGQSSVQRFAASRGQVSFRLAYQDAGGNWVTQLPVPVVDPLSR